MPLSSLFWFSGAQLQCIPFEINKNHLGEKCIKSMHESTLKTSTYDTVNVFQMAWSSLMPFSNCNIKLNRIHAATIAQLLLYLAQTDMAKVVPRNKSCPKCKGRCFSTICSLLLDLPSAQLSSIPPVQLSHPHC